MKIEIKREIAEELRRYMDAHKLSALDIIRICTIPRAQLSGIIKKDSDFMYLSGQRGRKNIPTHCFIKIAELIGFLIDKEHWKTQVTDQTNNVLAYLQDAKENSYTNVLIGQTGCGKSFTCNLFAKKHLTEVFIVTVGRSDTIKDLINKVISAIKLRTSTRSTGANLQAVISHLKQFRDTGRKPMLIFDESEYLKQSSLCAIKEFYDNLIGTCSIILIGTEQLIKNIDVMKKRDQDGIPQFYRRIKFGIKRLPVIDTSFDLFINEIECKNLKLFLRRYCENYGELHDILVPSRRESERLKEPLTLDLVRRVLNLSTTQYPL